MGLGAYFGYFVSQNGRGHVLGYVKRSVKGKERVSKHFPTFSCKTDADFYILSLGMSKIWGYLIDPACDLSAHITNSQ